jgi:hypothetical protein
MLTNAALVVRPFVGLAFLIAGVLLMRSPASRPSGWLLALGAVLFGGAETYGVFTLRPFVGGAYQEEWQAQVAFMEAASTLGLALCAAGALTFVKAKWPSA